MADISELVIIAEEIDLLKDKKTLSISDANRLMLICGRLTGILRVCSHDTHTRDFTQKVDDLILKEDGVGKLFYFIPVAIELLGRQYSGNARSIRKRYRSHKKKHSHKEHGEDEFKDNESQEDDNEKVERVGKEEEKTPKVKEDDEEYNDEGCTKPE